MRTIKTFKKKSFVRILLILAVIFFMILLSVGYLAQQNKINSLNKVIKANEVKTNISKKSDRNAAIEARRKELLNIFNSQDNTNFNNSDTSIKQSCQEDQTRYTSCLTEYNTKALEYQTCLQCKRNEDFGCDISCTEPYNNCNQYKPSSLCN